MVTIVLRHHLFSDQKIGNRIANTKESDFESYANAYVKDHWTKKVDNDLLEELKVMPIYDQKLITLPRWLFTRAHILWGLNDIILFIGIIIKSPAILTEALLIGVFLMYPRMQKIIEMPNGSDWKCNTFFTKYKE